VRPLLRQHIEVIRGPFDGSAHVSAPSPRRFDALGLAVLDAVTLVLRHEGQDLQHDVREKRAHQEALKEMIKSDPNMTWTD